MKVRATAAMLFVALTLPSCYTARLWASLDLDTGVHLSTGPSYERSVASVPAYLVEGPPAKVLLMLAPRDTLAMHDHLDGFPIDARWIALTPPADGATLAAAIAEHGGRVCFSTDPAEDDAWLQLGDHAYVSGFEALDRAFVPVDQAVGQLEIAYARPAEGPSVRARIAWTPVTVALDTALLPAQVIWVLVLLATR